MTTPSSKMGVCPRVSRFKGGESPAQESCLISENCRWSSEEKPWLEVQIRGHGYEGAALPQEGSGC